MKNYTNQVDRRWKLEKNVSFSVRNTFGLLGGEGVKGAENCGSPKRGYTCHTLVLACEEIGIILKHGSNNLDHPKGEKMTASAILGRLRGLAPSCRRQTIARNPGALRGSVSPTHGRTIQSRTNFGKGTQNKSPKEGGNQRGSGEEQMESRGDQGENKESGRGAKGNRSAGQRPTIRNKETGICNKLGGEH